MTSRACLNKWALTTMNSNDLDYLYSIIFEILSKLRADDLFHQPLLLSFVSVLSQFTFFKS